MKGLNSTILKKEKITVSKVIEVEEDLIILTITYSELVQAYVKWNKDIMASNQLAKLDTERASMTPEENGKRDAEILLSYLKLSYLNS